MRGYITAFLLFVCTAGAGAQNMLLEDGFEDGDFSANPAWQGDVNEFRVIDTDPNHLLQLQGTAGGGASYLSTPSTGTTGSWEFYFRYDASSAPSGSNKATIFLMSDRADLSGMVNGYALQVGRTGDDYFELVRYDQGTPSAPILSDTTLILHNESGYRVRVSRSGGGQWQLQTGSGYSGPLFDSGAQGLDNTYTASSWLGLLVQYTSTRTEQFYFDFKIDLPPFHITQVTSVDAATLHLSFNREVDESSVQAGDFSLNNGVGSPASVSLSEDQSLQLHFERPLPGGSYFLSATGLQDRLGNSLQPRDEPLIIYGDFAEGDVLINEFLYDPPDGSAEYIELHNTGQKYLDLSGWQVGDLLGSTALSSPEAILEPEGFLVLSRDTTSLYRIYGKRPYLQVNLPSLNNTGDAIRLITATGLTADSLSYTQHWGGDGIPLERRSAITPAALPANWGPAPNQTGTPGLPNAIEADRSPPELTTVTAADDLTLHLRFSEAIAGPTGGDPDSYRLSPAGSIGAVSAGSDTVALHLSEPMQPGTSYRLTARGISDLFGNVAAELVKQVAYRPPPGRGDLVINEIMYRPLSNSDDNRPDQSEYIELRNTREFALSLEGIFLHDAPDEQGRTRDLHPVSPTDKWVAPLQTVLIYADQEPDFQRSRTALYFDLKDVSEAARMRVDRASLSLASSGDAIYLASRTGVVIDSVYYEESWQNPNILDTRGIALERISPLSSSNDPANWGSSTVPRGGTPGKENSIYQLPGAPLQEAGLSLMPNPFSPDDDGHEDHLFIRYRLEQPDYLIRAEVYDRYGRYITTLADAFPAGYEGTLIWDGRREQGGRNKVGIYILVFEAYDSASGKNRAFKKTAVLARRFN